MIRIERITTYASEGTGRAQQVWQTVASQPGWITRFAILTFLFVIGLPIVLLVLLAMIAAVVIFGMLAIAHAIITRLRSLLPARREGRENVRVIRRI